MKFFVKKNLIENKNVIIVIDSLDHGGAEYQALMLAQGLTERGVSNIIFTLRGNGELSKKARALNINIIEGNFKSRRNFKSVIKGFILLNKTIRSSKPAIVHTFLPLSNFLGSLAGKISGASLIITSRRGHIKLNYLKKRWRIIDRLSNFFSHIITVNSQTIIDEMKAIDAVDLKKVACIPNGIDLNKFKVDKNLRKDVRKSLGLIESEFAWIKVANFSDIKGHADLIYGFSRINHNYSKKLFLLGRDRGNLKFIQKLVSDLGLQDQVIFLGFKENISQILNAMDGFISASHTEGLSNAIIEAMAMRLPIIATNVGGSPEILENRKYGILIEPNNYQSICKSMTEIMENDQLRANLSIACNGIAQKKYSKESMINSYIELYKSELKKCVE